MANIEHKLKTRLDIALMEKYPEISRGFLQKLCADDQVLIDGTPQKGGYKLRGNEKVEMLFDMQSIGKTAEIELPIVYEDENCLVVDKPSGILSHALSKFHGEPSVASFLRQKLLAAKDNNWKAEDLRFGIVHRLDRITSGLMICAKNQMMMRVLQKQFHDRTAKKTYRAIVPGTLKEQEALIDLPLERNPKAPATFRVGPNGKSAQTHYKVLTQDDTYSYIELKPVSGRTHQLRVHMQHLGHPIVGDFLYNGEKAKRLMLHAFSLEVELPEKGNTRFEAPMPVEFSEYGF